MSSDDRQTSPPPVVTVAPAETAAAPVAGSDLLAVTDTASPVLAEPQMLVNGLQYLKQRIPEFTHLSWQEKREKARAANLDPEFIEHGLRAAAVWHRTKQLVKRDGEELRQEEEEIQRWDQVIGEFRAILDGIEAANLKRRHRLGRAILTIYRILGIRLSGDAGEDLNMHPYYENMKRAYRKRTKKKKAEEPAEKERD